MLALELPLDEPDEPDEPEPFSVLPEAELVLGLVVTGGVGLVDEVGPDVGVELVTGWLALAELPVTTVGICDVLGD